MFLVGWMEVGGGVWMILEGQALHEVVALTQGTQGEEIYVEVD